MTKAATSPVSDRRVLPPHWRWVPLGAVADYLNGRAFKPEDWGSVGLPIIRIQNLTDAGAPFNRYAGPVEQKHAVQDGDLLISWSASLDAFIWERGPAVLNQHIFKVEERRNLITRDYLYFAAREAMAEIRGQVHGATMRHITKPEFEAVQIPLPPMAEQRSIAAKLKEQFAIIERARLATEERLRAAKTLAPAYVMREFGNGQSRQWPRKSLKALTFGNGQYGTSQKSHPTEAPGTVPVLGIGNIKGGVVVWHRLKFTLLAPEDSVKYRLKAGDLLFCRTNSADLVGETAVFDGSRDAAFASYLVRFRLNPELADPRFVSTYINSPWGRHFIQQNLSRAIGQANVSASVVANMEIPAPPVEVQRSIMDRLAHATVGAGRLAQPVSEELQSISRMPTALLRAAFQGDT